LSFLEAAAIPEVGVTAWTNLVVEGNLQAGQAVVMTAAASGVGTFAVQVARELGATVIVAGRDLRRLERLRALGASSCCLLRDDLPAQVRAANGDRGVELILDMAGGDWVPLLVRCLEPGGRLVLVGLMAGSEARIDLGRLMRQRVHLIGSVLRGRSREEKTELVAEFSSFARDRLQDRRLLPIIDRTFPFPRIADAYRAVEAGGVWGKVVVDFSANPG
jgi:NADPH:quinone reductase-like Zn-dependent oxidoreductase